MPMFDGAEGYAQLVNGSSIDLSGAVLRFRITSPYGVSLYDVTQTIEFWPSGGIEYPMFEPASRVAEFLKGNITMPFELSITATSGKVMRVIRYDISFDGDQFLATAGGEEVTSGNMDVQVLGEGFTPYGILEITVVD